MAKKKNTQPTGDLFTALCRSDLGVSCIKEYRFHPVRKWRIDYAIPSHKVALEVEGGVYTQGRHVRPKGFIGDMEKYNTMAVMGWRLLRVTPSDLLTKKTLQMLRDAIFCMQHIDNQN